MAGSIDPNAFTKPFMLTKAMHRDVYPAVDFTKTPSIRADGKVVVISGASGGIGHAVAKTWNAANASGIVLVGRNRDALQATANELDPSKVLVGAINISSPVETSDIIRQAVMRFGHVDVLINVAGSMNVGQVGTLEPEHWWENFESNVHGTYNLSHAFIQATAARGTIINLVSLGASFSAPGMSSYSSAKLAVIKIGEVLDAEHPGLNVFSVHPGMVEAENGRGMVVDHFTPFAKDKQALTGGLSLYLATPRAAFLSGGFVSANWDVTELERHKAEIREKQLIKLGFLNARLQPGGYPWTK